ncbi:hypothetical protein K501DRAFT_330812 [Backusella circina FSU 941]|nr:hypothetical protein K501DRAFT_330812 [Backusella circina FSU 941]
MNMNILERVDIPIDEKPNFSFKYSMNDNNLSNLKKTDNISKSRHNEHDIKDTSVQSEHEPLFYSKNMMDNSQQGDTIATIMKSNLWVPAKKHPQIAPAEFTNWIKQYKYEKPEEIKSKCNLRRKKSLLSDVSYPSSGFDSASSAEQTSSIEESKHRNTQKSLLRRQVVHARKKGQRGYPVSTENVLHELNISESRESQDQINDNIKNTNGQSFVTHIHGNETQVPTQQVSNCVIQQVPSPRLSITDISPKTETKSARMMEVMGAPHMCAQKGPSKKTWSFANLFKKPNNGSSPVKNSTSLSRFFSKALPNKNRQKSSLRSKRSSLVKKKNAPSLSCRSSFSPIDSGRLPLYVERAIYHLSHVKLANIKRPLCQQVVISNMMYTYLITSRNQSHYSAPPHFESSPYYPDRFEPPRHHTEEGFPDGDDAPLQKDSKKQKKKKYKPVQNKQYNSSVVV